MLDFANLFCKMQNGGVRKVLTLLANSKGETTPIIIFCAFMATGNSQRDVSPPSFRTRVAKHQGADVLTWVDKFMS